MARQKMDHKNPAVLPLAAAFVYLAGLFMMVMDKYLFGACLISAGMIAGAYSAITSYRGRYRPSRRPDPRWKKFIAPLVKASSRRSFRD